MATYSGMRFALAKIIGETDRRQVVDAGERASAERIYPKGYYKLVLYTKVQTEQTRTTEQHNRSLLVSSKSAHFTARAMASLPERSTSNSLPPGESGNEFPAY